MTVKESSFESDFGNNRNMAAEALWVKEIVF